MIKAIKNITLSLAVASATLFSACEDNVRYGEDVGEGLAQIEGQIQFKSFAPALSRSAGSTLDALKNVTVIVYNAQGTELIKMARFEPGNGLTVANENQNHPDNATEPEPGNTNRGTFKLGLDYGKYKIYAVANVPTLTEAEVDTEAKLKAKSYNWDSNNISNNAQMFGWFTENGTGQSANNVTENSGYDAPVITINRSNMRLYAWLVRLASKVTVAFDGSGLRSGVYVYIHDVSIRQIPLSCALGQVNKPTETNKVTPAYYDRPVQNKTQAIYYNSKGYSPDSTVFNPDNFRDWLLLSNGSGVLGSADHSNNDPALFFYENAQGDYSRDTNKNWYDKKQHKDSVGENVEPGDWDYRDHVPCGTFIEVQAYYRRSVYPVTYGEIRYRFMLGQDTDYNYNALRNYHYKVTLGFKGDANNPDWHIEYREPDHEIFAAEVYVPYSYNTYVDYPITITGSDLQALEAEIIENNWAPYQEGQDMDVPPLSSYGTTNFDNRTLEFVWWRDLFVNSSGVNSVVNINNVTLTGANRQFTNSQSNYLYGRHPAYNQDATPKRIYHLIEEGDNKGEEDISKPYYVTPIWAGFLRLRQPDEYKNSNPGDIPAYLQRNTNLSNSDVYGGGSNDNSRTVLNNFRNYYFGRNGLPENSKNINLSKRTFDVTEGVNIDDGVNNRYEIIKNKDRDGKTISTTIILRLWTQPKSMCGISGFSGNNPYEDYLRKAVIRFKATFTGNTVYRDVPVYQARRMINPKAVWRSYDNNDPFTVYLCQRDLNNSNRSTFNHLISQGAWSASISQGDKSFITLETLGSATGGGTSITGKDNTEINFRIRFNGKLGSNESKFAIVEVRYHNNSCVHNIYVRQGYNSPVQLTNGGPYWSSYNLYNCSSAGATNTPATGVFTTNPLAFGGMFKRGNYTDAISVSNISEHPEYFGPLEDPGSNDFTLNGKTDRKNWSAITSETTSSFRWKTFNVSVAGSNRTYRMPKPEEYRGLAENGDFGIGVLYGNGASVPAMNTKDAFGYMDGDNKGESSNKGMRGIICYNSDSNSAEHIFFPIGTTGMGRRTTQSASEGQYGTLRYSSVNMNLDEFAQTANSCRPIPVNMKNAPGAMYWLQTDVLDGFTYYGWDMNFFDLNFNGALNTMVLNSPGGDALPIRLVTDSNY